MIVWFLVGNGDYNLMVYMVKGFLVLLDSVECYYLLDFGEEVVNEYKLELYCEDDYVDELVSVICWVGCMGQVKVGWIYVFDIVCVEVII